MLIGIDGTSLYWDDAKYQDEMRSGFINLLVATTKERHAKYFRGPTLSGAQDPYIAGDALRQIRDFYLQHGDRRVVLAGYSRGGAIAIRVAQKLQEQTWARPMTIDCMALFDAVDRDVVINGETIPGNVTHAYHAMRNPSVESRSYFGNCGTKIDHPGRLIRKCFVATHAGMGGLPWGGDHPTRTVPVSLGSESNYAVHASHRSHAKTVEVRTITRAQDEAGSIAVRTWIWDHLRRHEVVP